MRLLSKVIDMHATIDSQTLLSAYSDAKARDEKFHILKYLKESAPGTDLGKIKNKYIKFACEAPGSLLEPGAIELIDFLKTNKHHHCIMSFGDPELQDMKIIGAGLEDIVRLIVSTEQKGLHIANWKNDKLDYFSIPEHCFKDGVPRKAKEVVLVDDTAHNFSGIPDGARGYLIQDIKRLRTLSKQHKVPPSVKRVTRLDEVLFHESNIINNRYIAKNTTD